MGGPYARRLDRRPASSRRSGCRRIEVGGVIERRHQILAAARTAVVGYVAITAVLLAVAVAVPALPVIGDALLDADRSLTDWVVDQRRDGLVTDAFTAMGDLADTFTILGVIAGAGVVLALVQRWREMAVLAVAVPVEMAVFVTVATLTGRERPEAALEPVAVAGSFPSGHAGMAVVVYGGLAVVVHRLTTDRVARRTAVVMATVLALAVGIGRLYLAMHHPTEIVVGWAEGALCLIVGVTASRHLAADRLPISSVGTPAPRGASTTSDKRVPS